MKKSIYLVFLLFVSALEAQTGSIKGIVIDKQSESPLEGATIELLNSAEATGIITNVDGRFTLENVPVGRHAIRISYIGFETNTISDITVSSGKDVILSIGLLEAFDQLDEVVLSAATSKDKAVNEMAKVSVRQFGVEEVTRFAGGRADVGRLAANFAGVSTPNDSRNDIVVRGNSPTGLLWQVEGIPIPSPNHFATAGTTGSPVSALNPNILKNSDFITSAFPAEYGNALGGVFDLGFRNGNIDDYEFSAQLGIFSGVELNAEGPVGKNNGSFLVAGRYSFISLIGAGGAGGTSAIPNYHDISFNFDLGKGKAGNFSLFGIYGASDIEFLGKDVNEDDLFSAKDENSIAESGFFVSGLKHRITLGENSFLRTIVAGSFSNDAFQMDRIININSPQERIIRYTEIDNSETRFTFSSMLNSKLSNKITLRAGVLAENFNIENLLMHRFEQRDADGDGDPDLNTFRDIDANLMIVQPYAQGQFRLTEDLTLDTGLHLQYSSLNDQLVVEPRASIDYKMGNDHRLSFGYGVHHQNIPFPLLFLNEEVNGQTVQTNKELDFVRSQHYVLGYDVKLGSNWRGKVEVYYQDIDKAGVDSFQSSYSTLTEGADFGFSDDRVSLVNEGTGSNKGVELTLEKFFSKGYYLLLTGSLFDAKYIGSDGIERNSPFNNRYVANLLAGKEFVLGKTNERTLFFDTRLTTSGGRYYTPIDIEASREAGYEIRQNELAYSQQYDDYLRWDFKFGMKFNRKKASLQFYVDFQNVTNNKNIFVTRYNRLTNNVDRVDQIGFFPDFGCKFQF